MASPPSSAIAGAAVAAGALASVLIVLARGLPAASDAAKPTLVTARRIALFDAPRIASRADAAAIARDLITAIQTLARATEPADVAQLLYAAAASTQACAPASASPALTRAYALARALCAAVEVACLGEAFVAEARTGFSDRPSADAARTRIRTAFDEAGDRIADALGQPTLIVLDTAARQTSASLVAEAATLKPVVQVEAAASFPAASLAWALYGDPERAADLLARNKVGTPFYMPASFEALSPESV